MNEGKKLAEMLEKSGITQADLARAANVERSAVYKWLRVELFESRMWESVKAAMKKVGLNHREIRDENIPNVDPTDIWVTKLDAWERDRIELLGQILEATPTARRMILLYVAGRLR